MFELPEKIEYIPIIRSQTIVDEQYENTGFLYRIDSSRFLDNFIYIDRFSVLSETPTGYWITNPYNWKKKRFVRKNSQFASISIKKALYKYNERLTRRISHLENDLRVAKQALEDLKFVSVVDQFLLEDKSLD